MFSFNWMTSPGVINQSVCPSVAKQQPSPFEGSSSDPPTLPLQRASFDFFRVLGKFADTPAGPNVIKGLIQLIARRMGMGVEDRIHLQCPTMDPTPPRPFVRGKKWLSSVSIACVCTRGSRRHYAICMADERLFSVQLCMCVRLLWCNILQISTAGCARWLTIGTLCTYMHRHSRGLKCMKNVWWCISTCAAGYDDVWNNRIETQIDTVLYTIYIEKWFSFHFFDSNA